jgi:hypothetical protein
MKAALVILAAGIELLAPVVCEDAREGFSEDDVELLGIIQG